MCIAGNQQIVQQSKQLKEIKVCSCSSIPLLSVK